MADSLANITTSTPEHIIAEATIFVSKDTTAKISFVFGMVLIPAFSLFGSIGNILSLIVLVHHRMRNSTNYCLAALAVSDFLFLSHSLWFAVINVYKSRDPIEAENIRKMTYPVLGAYGSVVTARITSWLTTMLSIERFIAVYSPIKAKTMCGKRHTCSGIIVIYLMTVLAFIPQALKYHTDHVTKNNRTIVILSKTILGKDKAFCTIYGTILNVVFRFVPICLLFILNILIIKAIRRTWNLRRLMSKNGNHCTMYEQNRITMMLLTVSFVFLVCILPGAINSIVSQIWKDYSRFGKNQNLYLCISCVTYFLETVNSSINFIIYMAFSVKFCRIYKEIFCCVPAPVIQRSSTREIIRFSHRPLGSGSSLTSYREFRFSSVLGDRRISYERCHKNGHVQSSFDSEQIKLLCHKGKKISAESIDSSHNQYN